MVVLLRCACLHRTHQPVLGFVLFLCRNEISDAFLTTRLSYAYQPLGVFLEICFLLTTFFQCQITTLIPLKMRLFHWAFT